MSFHFYSKEADSTLSLHIPFDEEDLEWFERNLILSKEIKWNSNCITWSDNFVKNNEVPNTIYCVQHKKVKFCGF